MLSSIKRILRGKMPLLIGFGARRPEKMLGLTGPKPRWQGVVEPPADPPQKGVALLKPTKGEAMLGSK